jgi:hypothetical protein
MIKSHHGRLISILLKPFMKKRKEKKLSYENHSIKKKIHKKIRVRITDLGEH